MICCKDCNKQAECDFSCGYESEIDFSSFIPECCKQSCSADGFDEDEE
jgi:hypothetical protein